MTEGLIAHHTPVDKGALAAFWDTAAITDADGTAVSVEVRIARLAVAKGGAVDASRNSKTRWQRGVSESTLGSEGASRSSHSKHEGGTLHAPESPMALSAGMDAITTGAKGHVAIVTSLHAATP